MSTHLYPICYTGFHRNPKAEVDQRTNIKEPGSRLSEPGYGLRKMDCIRNHSGLNGIGSQNYCSLIFANLRLSPKVK
jgi:hypothetical protein